MRRKVFPCTDISLVDRRDLGDRDNVFPYEHNIATAFPISGKSFLQILARHTKVETLPGKRDNVFPYEQNKIIWLVEMFSR